VPVAPIEVEEVWGGGGVACDRDRLAAAPPVEPGIDPSDDDPHALAPPSWPIRRGSPDRLRGLGPEPGR
jgi:hypothetical protein